MGQIRNSCVEYQFPAFSADAVVLGDLHSLELGRETNYITAA